MTVACPEGARPLESDANHQANYGDSARLNSLHVLGEVLKFR